MDHRIDRLFFAKQGRLRGARCRALTPATGDDALLTAAYETLRDRFGLAFSSERRAMTEPKLREALAGVRVEEIAARPEVLERLVGAVTVGETYFFRNPEHFDFVREALIAACDAGRADHRPINLWSAGCSTGEEAYSLAILAEQLGLSDRTAILATDINLGFLDRAKQGLYSDWSLRGDDGTLAARYFRAEGKRWRLAERIRRRVSFAWGNLCGQMDRPEDRWGREMDVIMCRNVLIYFDHDTLRRVAGRLRDSLAIGGWLITGPSDPLLNDISGLEPVTKATGIAYRRVAEETRAAEQPDRWEGSDDAGRTRGPGRAKRRPGPAKPERHDMTPAFHHAQTLDHLAAGRYRQAAESARKVVYLDRSLAVGHMTLGLVEERLGRRANALRALRNAQELLAEMAGDAPVALSDGLRVDAVSPTVSAHIRRLEAAEEDCP